MSLQTVSQNADFFPDRIQRPGKPEVVIDRSRDALLSDFGKNILKDRYLLEGEKFQDLFARVASSYGDDQGHAQRLYDYMSNLWFMPSTPILSNGGTNRGLPISCFLNESTDSLNGILDLWNENVWLASKGGGIGSYWGNLRSIGESVGSNGQTSGIIPFIHVMDSMTLAISQGSLRRGSAAVYLPVDHPEIEEFIEIRRSTGGDPNRRSLNLHHGITIPDSFMHAVKEGTSWVLLSPKSREVISKVDARALWARILTARLETGEPYLVFIDTVNRMQPKHHHLAGLRTKTSNLCSEITLPTGLDHHNNNRTAVCCLSSLNLTNYDAWKDDDAFIPDVMRFLDNVLTDFIQRAPKSMEHARYSAGRERSVGLGVMGFHSFLQEREIPFDSVMSRAWTRKIFRKIQTIVQDVSVQIASEKGPCPDAEEYGFQERFSHKTAVAPTASISIICGGVSPGIEPLVANSYTHKTLSGSFSVRNPVLQKLIAEKNCNVEDVWNTITMNHGSVQNLETLSQEEREVFKTAFEIDQMWIIDMASDRSPLVDQSSSVNVFLPADVSKKILHDLHFNAWKQGVKSLYYCRSLSLQRPKEQNLFPKDEVVIPNDDECLACQ